MPTPPPGVKAGKTVRCDVSLRRSVLVTVTPRSSAPGTSATASVLPRRMPCWSANEKRTAFRWCASISLRMFTPPGTTCRSRGFSRPPFRLAAPAVIGAPPVLVHRAGRPDAVDRRRPGELGRLGRLEHHHRPLARFIFADRVHQQAPIEHDALVG